MEQAFSELSLKDKEIKKINITLEEFSITTKLSSNDFKIYFPKEILEFISLDEHFSPLLLDTEKFKNIIFPSLQSDSSDNKIDLTENPYLSDRMILKAIFGFLGSVNSKNDFLQYTSDDYLSNIEEDHFIENTLSYSKYLEINIPIIFSTFKIKDLDQFVKDLDYIGIDLLQKNNIEKLPPSPIYTKIKNFVWAKNKLLIVITPSNNFWIKTEKITIGSKNYDKKINNYSMIFYNWNFIHKFYDRIASHPRCSVGFLNSMVKKNLEPCIVTIPISVKNFTRYVLFDQDSHDSTSGSGSKPVFSRNIEKMKSKCKSYEDSNFNETNMIILESEMDKIGASTKNNSIPMNVFSEEYLTYTPKEIENFEKKVENIFEYVEKMLNECDCDVREYLTNVPFN